MNSSLKIVIPLIVLALGGGATVGLVAASPELGTAKPQHRAPSVRTVQAELASVTLRVHTQGSVVPRTESDLVAEVSGRIIRISPSLASGGFRIISGEPSRFRSSERGTRSFCPRCGTPLTFQFDALPDEIDVTTCSLKNPEQLAPKDHTQTDTQLAWLEIGDRLPRFRGSRS